MADEPKHEIANGGTSHPSLRVGTESEHNDSCRSRDGLAAPPDSLSALEPPPITPNQRLPLPDKLGYLALLVLAVVVAFQLGLRRGARDVPAAGSGDFYPVWAATGSYNRPISVEDTDSALGRRNLHPKQLTLKDLALVHGHLCDGLVISWIELGMALRELFPDGVVDRTDLRVVAKNGPCGVDAAASMTGARVNHGTLVLDNGVGEGFVGQRIGSGDAIRVWLRPKVFPSELAALELSIRNRRAKGEAVQPEQIDHIEALAADLSRRLLNTPPEEVIEMERLTDFSFPTQSPNLIAPRSDIINCDLGRTSGSSQGAKP